MAEKSVNITIRVGVKGVAEKEKLIKNLEKLGNTASKTGKKTEASLKEITPTMQKLWQEADKLGAHWGVSMQTALPYVKKLGQGFKFATTDTYQLAQAAEALSKKFKVSFKESYAILKQMGVGFKGVSNDINKTAKIARKFSQNWGVSFGRAFKHVNKLGVETKKVARVVYNDVDKTAKVARKFSQDWGVSFKAAHSHVRKMGIGMKKTEKQVTQSGKNINMNFTLIAWHFRYLGNIFDRVSKSMVRVIKDVIKVSSELEESFLSISTAGTIFGQDAKRASEFARELSRTGLIPLKESANSVKNLMITGLGLPELEKFTYRYLDVAFLFTSGADEMSQSLETISKSILKGTMQLATDSTAKELWITTEKRLEKTVGLTMKQLTAKQRALELLTTIETKWAATQGLHEMEMETTRAAMTRLNLAITEIKNSLGIALLPILHAVSAALIKVSVYVNSLLDALGPVVPVIIAIAVAVAFLVSKISFTIGVFISLMKVAGMTALTMWKIVLPMLAIGVLVAAATYLYLKYSGALDQASNSATRMKEQLEALSDKLKGMQRDESEVGVAEESRRIAHERATEDIMEDLDKERSKGLWANQMSIKDLEKRLKRENEDWDLYLRELGNKDIDDPTSGVGLGGVFGDLLSGANEAAKGLGNIDWWGGLLKSSKAVINAITTEFQRLPRIIQGIFAGITTYFSIIWLGSIIKTLGLLVVAFKAKFLAIGSMWGLLAATISTPLAISIVVAAAVMAIMEVIDAYKELEATINGLDDSITRMSKSQNDYLDMIAEKFGKQSNEYNKAVNSILRDNKQVIKSTNEAVDALDPLSIIKGMGGTVWNWLKSPVERRPSFKDGGIVPGLTNQAVPIIAHGGERVIPAGESAGENVTININSPVVREEEDINKIARAVSNVLGQRQRFSRLGAF
ncbi:MAG TPA: hypothetical protein ENI23_00005 [bacterium]|nr:hypothetical protein [bacterium]